MPKINDVTETEARQIIEIHDPKNIEIVLNDNHDALLAGHYGTKRTLRKIREKYNRNVERC